MKIQLVILVVVFVVLSAAKPSTDDEWKEFKNKHGKAYKHSKEEGERRKKFDDNKARIDKHNEEAAAGKHSWKKGINQFTDMTQDEFVATLTEKDDVFGKFEPGHSQELVGSDRQGLPASYDLNSTACMQPPRDQGQCGCCWSFAAVGVLEYLQCKKTSKATILSEQNLVDCSSSYGNAGCNGGLALYAFEYAKTYGVNPGSSYPFKGAAGTCTYSSSSALAKVSSWNYATQSWNESSIASALVQYGPVAVSIDASNISSYSSGVYVDTACSTTSTNHAVVVVGYGYDSVSKQDYWVIRNSWGTTWGMKGYMRFKRGVNQCAIAKRPVYAILA